MKEAARIEVSGRGSETWKVSSGTSARRRSNSEQEGSDKGECEDAGVGDEGALKGEMKNVFLKEVVS